MLELRDQRAYWRGVRVELTLNEFALVQFLVNENGRDASYRELYDVVRGEGFSAGYGSEGFRANIRNFIRNIRKKFRDVDPEFDGIENYESFGYCWRECVETPTVLREVE